MEHLLAAPLLVQLHILAALAALILGVWQLVRPKGGGAHRWRGRVWVGLMAALALSSFGITGADQRYSWIHGISGAVLIMVPLALLHARQGRIASHKRMMLGLFWGALIVTGAFTFTPGRLLHQVFLGG
jgi:uncharacterized membrane protein